jgi:TonB family protein
MKQRIILLVLFSSIIINLCYSQSSDSVNVTNDVTTEQIDAEKIKADQFKELYEINIALEKQAKLLGECPLLAEPSPNSQVIDIIPQGTILKTYKYYAKEMLWAVRYKKTWGFITATMVMPVQETVAPSNFTPYDEAPKLQSRISLEYPSDAKSKGIEGKIILKLLIGKDGKVKETEVIKSIPELDAAAIKAVKDLKFRPGKYKGKPVEVWVRFPLTFEIN